MMKFNRSDRAASKQHGRGRRRAFTIAGTAGMLIGGGFIANALFTANVQPWAAGETATVVQPTATAVVTGAIWPGDCNDVSLTVSNTMPKGITVTGISNTGFRNVSDMAASQNGNANRLEDFLTQANVASALNGKVVGANDSKTFTVPNAVCLSAQADDARQGKDFEAGYFVAFTVNGGNEAP